MRRKLIAGNWKMNMLFTEGLVLAGQVVSRYKQLENPKFDILMCPPMTLLKGVCNITEKKVFIGAQDVSNAPKMSGAFTGQVSAEMVKDLGATHTLVGHSERRTLNGETDEIVCQKAQNAHAAGLVSVICVGETLQEREAGNHLTIVKNQVKNSVPANATAENTIIAYEPVWAIGTGKVPSTDDVAEMHLTIRQELTEKLGAGVADNMLILYGGSVKPSNAKQLLSVDNVDGALIGGASLKIDDFWAIAETQL